MLNVVCFSWDPWSFLWKRKQYLLFELSKIDKIGKVLYVEPYVTITDILESALRGVGDSSKKELYKRALQFNPKKVSTSFYLLSPLYPFPFSRTLRFIKKMNYKSWLIQIKASLKKLKINNFVLWLYHPSQLPLLDIFSSRILFSVYDWTDDWVEAYPEDRPLEEKKLLAEYQRQLLKKIDVIFAVSKRLSKKAKKFCDNVYYLPNATNPFIFKPTVTKGFCHIFCKNIKGPKLVYLSQITSRVDFDLVKELALRRPRWNIIFVGPIIDSCKDSVNALKGIDNIYFLGALPYRQAAQLVSAADVCILPHKVNKLTYSLDPIKIYDYMATGRPVVSTPVSIHDDFVDYIYVARNADEFIKAIEIALKEPPSLVLERRKLALNHTWEKRARDVVKFFEQYLWANRVRKCV